MTLGTTKKNGFTLAEICVAAALTGLVCLIAWPAIRGYMQRVSADAQGSGTAVEQLLARERAIWSGKGNENSK